MPQGHNYRFRYQKASFWMPGSYKLVLKRLKAGAMSTSNLISYMKGRVNIVRNFEKKLERWLIKWVGGVALDEEDQGMLITVLKLINYTQEQQLDAQRRMRDVVYDIIVPKLKIYQRYSRKKGLRELHKEFDRAQKPWHKAMKKLEKIKIIYHEACRTCQETQGFLQSNSVPSGHGVTEMTPELREKTQQKYDEYVVEVDRCRNVYEATLYELNFLKAQYKEGMRAIFDKCISIERERLICFRECLGLFARAIDFGRDPQYASAWERVDNGLNTYTVDEDLNVFSTTVGPDMPYVWPHFEEWQNRPSQVYYD